MNTKVSVIIPIYNMERYLVECLDSVQSQSLSEIEIIAINDGSTDHSLEILNDYAAKDSRIKIIDKKNAGVAAARNDGLEMAVGEFIAFMDPDDYYPNSNVLEKCYAAAKEYGVAIAGGDYRIVLPDGTARHERVREAYGIKISPKGLTEYREYQYDYGYQCFIYSRKLLTDNNILFPLYSRFQDPPFFVKAMISAQRFYALEEETYCYRAAFNSGKTTPRKAIDFIKGLADNLATAKDNDLAQLYYITVNRLDKEASYMFIHNLECPEIRELTATYVKAISSVDTKWLQDQGYDIPDCFVPECFNYLISTTVKYEKLRNNKALRIVKSFLKR